jgi:hypothetical protein
MYRGGEIPETGASWRLVQDLVPPILGGMKYVQDVHARFICFKDHDVSMSAGSASNENVPESGSSSDLLSAALA